jgi:excisionase family DNA binding protein
MNLTPDRVLNCKETAELLGVSLRTLDRIAAEGSLPKIKLSPGRVGFRQRDVLAWIESRAAKTAA